MGRGRGDKFFDRPLFDKAPVLTSPGAVEIQKSKEEGQDRPFRDRH
jgi:hypothetical protein